MMYWHTGMGPVGWLFMVAGSVVFALCVGFAVAAAVRTQRWSGPTPPERILADRYARGEMDDDEYRRRLTTLRHP